MLLCLAWTGFGFGQGQEKMILGGDKPAFSGFEGYALRKALPIGDLPKRIVFKAGEVSLIADPEDQKVIWAIPGERSVTISPEEGLRPNP